jgi:hypothetical protein
MYTYLNLRLVGLLKTLGAYKRHLPDCTHLVQAVGFTGDPLPQLSRNGQTLNPELTTNSAMKRAGFFEGCLLIHMAMSSMLLDCISS